MSEETKSGLADSDKGSDSDGDEPVGSSRQKINSTEQKGAVEIRAEFEDDGSHSISAKKLPSNLL